VPPGTGVQRAGSRPHLEGSRIDLAERHTIVPDRRIPPGNRCIDLAASRIMTARSDTLSTERHIDPRYSRTLREECRRHRARCRTIPDDRRILRDESRVRPTPSGFLPEWVDVLREK